MRRTAVVLVAAVLGAVPLTLSAFGNASFSESVPVRVPPAANVLDDNGKAVPAHALPTHRPSVDADSSDRSDDSSSGVPRETPSATPTDDSEHAEPTEHAERSEHPEPTEAAEPTEHAGPGGDATHRAGSGHAARRPAGGAVTNTAGTDDHGGRRGRAHGSGGSHGGSGHGGSDDMGADSKGHGSGHS